MCVSCKPKSFLFQGKIKTKKSMKKNYFCRWMKRYDIIWVFWRKGTLNTKSMEWEMSGLSSLTVSFSLLSHVQREGYPLLQQYLWYRWLLSWSFYPICSSKIYWKPTFDWRQEIWYSTMGFNSGLCSSNDLVLLGMLSSLHHWWVFSWQYLQSICSSHE